MRKFIQKIIGSANSTPLPSGFQKRTRATIFTNQDFIFIVAESGRIRTVYDYEAYSTFLDISAPESKIGGSIRAAFDANRFIEDDVELLEFCSQQACKERADEWEATTMRKFGYKTKKEMYSQMAHVGCDVLEQNIKISRSQKSGLKRYTGIAKEYVLLNSVSDDKIGATIKEMIATAFSSK